MYTASSNQFSREEYKLKQPQKVEHEGVVHTFALLLVGLVLRLFVLCVVLAQHASGSIYKHGLEMGLLAKSIVEGHGLGSPFGEFTGPTAYFAPAYPFLVASVFRVFGSYSVASEIVIIGAQIFMNEITIWLILVVTRRLFGARPANIAGFIWACSLPLIWLPTLFWETSLSTCVLAGFLPLALRCLTRPSTLLWIGAGAYCGLAALVNPALLPSCIATFLWAAYRNRGVSLITTALGLLVAAIILSPWVIRNERALHTFVPARSNMGYELWMGNHPGASGYLEEATFPLFDKQELDDYKSMGEIAYSANKSSLAKSYIHDHPKEFILLSVRRVIRFWSGTGGKGGSIFYAIHALTTTFFGVAGLWLLFRHRNRATAILLSFPIVLLPLPYYVTHAEFRFRILIDPLMSILAGYGISELYHRLQRAPVESPVIETDVQLAAI